MLIVITTPDFFAGEADLINLLFVNGLQRLHLRKPDSTRADYEGLLKTIAPEFLPKIVLHDHFDLAAEYGVHGVHLNRRNNQIPKGFCGSVSKSLHTVEELSAEGNNYDYVTISPIFDSVSKQGYNSQFSHEKLMEMRHNGLIDSHVIALGGITPQNIAQLQQYGFGGAMVLGALWNRRGDRESFLEVFRDLQTAALNS
ncbi:MAG: thiamine phosphate synthase [Bacteroidales bacterium]|nr:thiamine phosphate synthase [Bacteroidales bacterium]